MKLKKARVQNYRSIRDTGEFEIEAAKTILVGPNEAGKTAILQALQQINAPKALIGFDTLRDYPRADYNDITVGKVDPTNIEVITATFILDDDDKALIPETMRNCNYEFTRYLDGGATHTLVDAPEIPNYGAIQKDLLRLAAHVDRRAPIANDGQPAPPLLGKRLAEMTRTWPDTKPLDEKVAGPLKQWLNEALVLVDEQNEDEDRRIDRLRTQVEIYRLHDEALAILNNRIPIFVLYSNYFRVRPIIHLAHLADRIEKRLLDDNQYDYGNTCLLKLLGFTAKELSDLGKAKEPEPRE